MRNILLIVVDTLRPDHLGCYGYGRPTSPRLDELAARSTVLDSLWSVSNFTAPAFTSLFTGLYPHHHGVFDFTAQARSSPIAALLAANRVHTAGVVAFRFFGNLLRNIWGDIEAVTDTRSFNFAKTLPQDVTDSSLAWLRRHGGRDDPFCLFVHYDGPHMPFRLPDQHAGVFDSVPAEGVDAKIAGLLFPRAERLDDARNKSSMYRFMRDVNRRLIKIDPVTLQWIVDQYDAAVRFNDLAIGRLLDGLAELGLAEDTVVAVLSDHGEEFLEHGGFAHGGIHLYEEIVRTVGIVHDPARPGGGRRVAEPASQVDLLPALLEVAGADDLPGPSGRRGLAGMIAGAPGPNGAPVFCHGKSKVAVRSGPLKLIVPRPNPSLGRVTRWKMWAQLLLLGQLKTELYDLEQDPGETVNLAGDRSRRRPLERILAEHLAAAPPATLASHDLADAERARIEQEMKDLGYL